MSNDTIVFDSNQYAKHDKFVELANNLTNDEKCLLITTLTSSMTDSVDVLLTDKQENIKAVFSCTSTWMTAYLNGLTPVFAFELDYVSMISKGKDSVDKLIAKHVNERDNKKEK